MLGHKVVCEMAMLLMFNNPVHHAVTILIIILLVHSVLDGAFLPPVCEDGPVRSGLNYSV